MAFTYFFRDLQTLELLVERLLLRVSGRAQINIWDAGCASGQEPYTLAILLAEKMGEYSYKNVNIYATDIDISNSFREKIENGIYKEDDVKRIPENILKAYFNKLDSGEYQVVPHVRSRMKFIKHDLLTLNPVKNDFSMILCKNVLLHFSPEQRIEVLKMFHKSLLRDGLIAMEHTQFIPDEIKTSFEKEVPNAQIFKKIG